MVLFTSIIAVLCAYLIGAVPFGLLFTKFFTGIDVRTVGSGNIGATNVLRASGKTAALLTLFADALKGFIPVLIVSHVFQSEITTSLAGAAAFLGHCFPIYLKFKGGKGVATGYGVIFAVAPWIGTACILLWLVAAFIWKYSSLSAIISFSAYPLLTFAFYSSFSRPSQLLSLTLFSMIYYRHRENIKRLLAGTEPKIGST